MIEKPTDKPKILPSAMEAADKTNLTAKEDALRELKKECNNIMRVRNVKSALAESPKTAQRFLTALANAKAALEDKR